MPSWPMKFSIALEVKENIAYHVSPSLYVTKLHHWLIFINDAAVRHESIRKLGRIVHIFDIFNGKHSQYSKISFLFPLDACA